MWKLSPAMTISIIGLGLAQWSNSMSATSGTSINADRDVVTIVRYFDSTPAQVWRAWTDPEQICRWFGSDPNGKSIAATADVRVGGSYSVTFADSDGTQHTASGEYFEVEPYSKLVFSWRWKSEPGATSSVTVELEPDKNGTKMRFQHAGIGYGSAHNFEQGWQSTFDKLERTLATP